MHRHIIYIYICNIAIINTPNDPGCYSKKDPSPWFHRSGFFLWNNLFGTGYPIHFWKLHSEVVSHESRLVSLAVFPPGINPCSGEIRHVGSERVRFIHHEFLWIGFGSVSLRNRDVTSNSCGQYIYKYINGVYYIYNIIYMYI